MLQRYRPAWAVVLPWLLQSAGALRNQATTIVIDVSGGILNQTATKAFAISLMPSSTVNCG